VKSRDLSSERLGVVVAPAWDTHVKTDLHGQPGIVVRVLSIVEATVFEMAIE
jgi:hypothetical protein